MTPIKLGQKLAYSGGDLGFNLLFGSVGAFLLYFYTDVFGISAAQAGLVLLVARLWDAVWDVGLGAIVDRTRTRLGQMRPYLIFGAPVLGLAAVACFSVPPLEGIWRVVYAFVTYTVLMSAYSLVNIPYGALPTLMSADSQQRTRLASWRMFFGFAGTMMMGAATQPLVAAFGHGDPAAGFQRVILLYATLLTVLVWICAAVCRERVAAFEVPRETPWKDLRTLFGSRAWRCLALANLIVFSLLLLPLANAVYYMTYVVGQPAMIPFYMIASGVAMMVAAVVSGALTHRFCKRSVWRVSTMLAVVGFLGVWFIDAHDLRQVLAMVFVANVCAGISVPINFSMASDVADAIEAEHGNRLPGLVFSTLSFTGKAGLGLSGAIAGFVLAACGYVPNAAQPQTALHGILACMSLIPAGGCLLLCVVQRAYPYGRMEIQSLGESLARVRGGVVAS